MAAAAADEEANLRLRVSSLSTSSTDDESLFGVALVVRLHVVPAVVAVDIVVVDVVVAAAVRAVRSVLILSGSVIFSYSSNLFAKSVMEADFASDDDLPQTLPLRELCLLCWVVWLCDDDDDEVVVAVGLWGFSLDWTTLSQRCSRFCSFAKAFAAAVSVVVV